MFNLQQIKIISLFKM